MNTEKLNNWLQVFANFGILLGLVLVGFQMKQNSDLLRIEMLYAGTDRVLDTANVMLGENPAEVWAKALTNPLELTLEEQLIVESYLFVSTENWRSTYDLVNQGLLEEEWKQRVEEDANYFLNNPYGRAYLEKLKTFWPEELIEHIEYVLDENPIGGFQLLEFQESIMQDTERFLQTSQ